MKVLAITPTYLPQQYSGGEMMLHDYLWFLQNEANCNVNVITTGAVYDNWQYDNIPVNWYFNGKQVKEAAQWADVIITHLGSIGLAQNMAWLTGTPLVYIQHNTHVCAAVKRDPNIHVIYNASWYIDQLPYNHSSSMVGYPILYLDSYKNIERKDPKYITLANANENKGGFIFDKIAKQMPNEQFLATGGYGRHRLENSENNITFVENQPIERVLEQTKILLMPSKQESFGRLGVEAQAAGIPVIATDLPGIREALGLSFLSIPDRSDIDAWVDRIKIVNEGFSYVNRGLDNVKRIDLISSNIKQELLKFLEYATSKSIDSR